MKKNSIQCPPGNCQILIPAFCVNLSPGKSTCPSAPMNRFKSTIMSNVALRKKRPGKAKMGKRQQKSKENEKKKRQEKPRGPFPDPKENILSGN